MTRNSPFHRVHIKLTFIPLSCSSRTSILARNRKARLATFRLMTFLELTRLIHCVFVSFGSMNMSPRLRFRLLSQEEDAPQPPQPSIPFLPLRAAADTFKLFFFPPPSESSILSLPPFAGHTITHLPVFAIRWFRCNVKRELSCWLWASALPTDVKLEPHKYPQLPGVVYAFTAVLGIGVPISQAVCSWPTFSVFTDVERFAHLLAIAQHNGLDIY
ncbi:hypothetical protein C8R45DRAFT_494855 [Mycena sanguinolenta]|nr:hypothetical protein C8R45DRAFT_494855 [Mycena sanguinolenta]